MSADLFIRKVGKAGWITLNRPKALNALTHDMVLGIQHALDDWRNDPSVQLILIDGEGPRAFCAGGDIKEIYDNGLKGDHYRVREFLADEYKLDADLAEYPKPIVSFLHGTVMGGGVGIGCHVSHRVVDPEASIAMPECRIGLIPDVGGTLLLANAPGRIGEFMALCGAPITGDEAIGAGFADHLIPMSDWDGVKSELCSSGRCFALTELEMAPSAWSEKRLDQINAVFSGETVADILASSEGTDHLTDIKRGSPISQRVALTLVRNAREFDAIRDALEHEFRFMGRATEVTDCLEGVRAVLIDRDNQPDWNYRHAADVPNDLVKLLTSPLEGYETLFSNQKLEETPQ